MIDPEFPNWNAQNSTIWRSFSRVHLGTVTQFTFRSAAVLGWGYGVEIELECIARSLQPLYRFRSHEATWPQG